MPDRYTAMLTALQKPPEGPKVALPKDVAPDSLMAKVMLGLSGATGLPMATPEMFSSPEGQRSADRYSAAGELAGLLGPAALGMIGKLKAGLGAGEEAVQGIKAYHGSPRTDLTKFDPNALGIPQLAESSALGTFFSREALPAQHYTTRGGQGPGRVYPATISGRLYPLSREEFASIGSRAEFRALRDRLAREGYDGVEIPHLGEMAVWNEGAMQLAPETR